MIVAQDRNKPTVIGNECSVLRAIMEALRRIQCFLPTDAAKLKLLDWNSSTEIA